MARMYCNGEHFGDPIEEQGMVLRDICRQGDCPRYAACLKTAQLKATKIISHNLMSLAQYFIYGPGPKNQRP